MGTRPRMNELAPRVAYKKTDYVLKILYNRVKGGGSSSMIM